MKTIVNRFYAMDTEFYNTKEMYVTPVCASVVVGGKTKTFIHPQQTPDFVDYIRELHSEGYTCTAYVAEAECRYLQAVGLDPLKEGLRFLDLYILYRMLSNNFDEIEFGRHLVDGKVRKLCKPPCKWDLPDMSKEEIEEAMGEGQQMQYSLASATYKFLGVIRDTEDKEAARNRIIAGGPFTQQEIEWITAYCEEDTIHLPELANKMLQVYREMVPEYSMDKLVKLSSYAVHTAEMVRIGYPVQKQWLAKVVENVPYLIAKECWNLLKQSARLELPFIPLTWDRKEMKYKENQKLIKSYIEREYPNATKTDKDNISISEEALEKFRTPETQQKKFVDYFLTYRRILKTLKSFRPGKGKRNIYDFMGSDGRVRPYFGIFGAQTSRSQPASSGFIFLKSACMRHLVQPAKGKMIVGIDYSSQEFLINAILADDKEMLSAYKSGDPYIFLGKKMKTIPANGTKETHKSERKEAKELELGLSYGMGGNGVAQRIGCTVERARELMELRSDIYYALTQYRAELKRDYHINKTPLVLPDGWVHGPDNDNDLSMLNFPTQGHGAVVMREAVRLAHSITLPVIQTLHDALYFELDFGDWYSVDRAIWCMLQGFKNVMGPYEIRVETHAWGPDFEEGYIGKGAKQTYRHTVTPLGNTVSYENMYWDDKVGYGDRVFWHNFVLDDRFDAL